MSRLMSVATAAILSVAFAISPMAPALAAPPPAAVETPDASIKLSAGDVAAGVGFVWGGGSVSYQGQEHPFKISGLSVVDIGAAHVSAAGSVYHLKRLEDFPGIYTVFSAGATIAGGGNAMVLRNQNGVILKLHGSSEGLRFNLAGEGLTVKFKK